VPRRGKGRSGRAVARRSRKTRGGPNSNRGIATATEVSTVGVVYTAFAGLFIYRQFNWRRLYPMLIETASLSGAILLIIGTATAMAWSLTAPRM